MDVSTTRGSNEISVRTLERVVTQAIHAVDGTVEVDSKLAGIGGRGYPRVIVQSDPDKAVAAVDATIATTWPAPVNAVAAATRESIIAALEAFTGHRTTRVNVVVGDVVTAERLSQAQPATFTAARPTTRHTTPVRSINVDEFLQSRAERELKPIETKPQLPVRQPVAPVPQSPTTPAAPPVPALRPVQITPLHAAQQAMRTVTLPPQQVALRPITVQSLLNGTRPITVQPVQHTRRVQVPQPAPLRHIEVRSTTLQPIEVKPLSLRPIEVVPLFAQPHTERKLR